MSRIRGVAVGVPAIALLTACTPLQQAAIDAALVQGEAGIKAAHDREAVALKQAPCAMSIGGYVRVLTSVERDAVLTLCGGEQGMTLEDLANLGRALDLLQEIPGQRPGATGDE